MLDSMSDTSIHSSSLPIEVRKRDGQTLQPFDVEKVKNAVRAAWLEVEKDPDEKLIGKIVFLVVNSLAPETVDVEKIQDLVEVAIMKYRPDVAKAYIVYRHRRAEARKARLKPDPTAISDYIHFAKYARYRSDLMRRELYAETSQRVRNMHLQRFAHLPEVVKLINWAFDRVDEKKVLPSMRSMQFGGPAVLANNARQFNCCATYMDRPKAFAEVLWLLLSGCGVGYSVQFEHVEKLPSLKRIDRSKVVHHVIEDTIEGWADALDALINSYINGYYLEISYHKIRPAGAPLKTSGGRAPGHLELKKSLELIRGLLDGAQGRKLRPIEVHDINCLAAEAVLSGGIRRSAMLSLFSLEDSEMMYAKTGDWFDHRPWRQNSNNSVALKRDEIKKKHFKRIFKMTREWGEPGFVFCEDLDFICNPCVEIGLNSKLIIDDDVLSLLEKRRQRGKFVPNVKLGEVYTGFSFCNLTEINAAKFTSYEEFEDAARAATIIGTLQASYSEFGYLSWVSEVIAEREALIGVSMTGMLDAPGIACNAEYQQKVAAKVVEWNREIAGMIDIRPAARATTIKPAGTSSLVLGNVASGHHPHHARRYIRRVTADELEVVFQAFREVNPHMCVRKPNGKFSVEFPIEVSDGAVVKDDLSAIQFLEMVKSTQMNWVLPGTGRPESSPGYSHNVSNTVVVKPDEWDEVAEYLFNNKQYFTGVSLLPASGDKDYAFAPHEAIVTEADEARFNQLVSHYKPMDYTSIIELEDGTRLSGEAACAGGACALV
jgi:ribonucleoside-triphosphate reductase